MKSIKSVLPATLATFGIMVSTSVHADLSLVIDSPAGYRLSESLSGCDRQLSTSNTAQVCAVEDSTACPYLDGNNWFTGTVQANYSATSGNCRVTWSVQSPGGNVLTLTLGDPETSSFSQSHEFNATLQNLGENRFELTLPSIEEYHTVTCASGSQNGWDFQATQDVVLAFTGCDIDMNAFYADSLLWESEDGSDVEQPVIRPTHNSSGIAWTCNETTDTDSNFSATCTANNNALNKIVVTGSSNQ